MSKEPSLVPGRKCGRCTACCVSLRIEEDRLQKHADVVCPNLSGKGLCKIYPERPSACRVFFCEWRFMPQLGNEWRPDRTGIMLRVHDGPYGGLILQALKAPLEVLTSKLAMSLVGSCVANSVPVFISVPGKPGHCYALVELNTRLEPAVMSRDLKRARAAVLDAVRYASELTTDPVAPLVA